MPFKSESQRRKFGAMVGRGEISKETYKEFDMETGKKKLPEKVKPKKKPKSTDEIREIYKKKYGNK